MLTALLASVLCLTKNVEKRFYYFVQFSSFELPTVSTRQRTMKPLGEVNHISYPQPGKCMGITVMEYLRYQWAPSGQRPRMSGSGGDTRGEHSTCLDTRSGPVTTETILMGYWLKSLVFFNFASKGKNSFDFPD